MSHSHERPRALITGISGFIGSHLANHLQDSDWEVHGLVRQSSTLATHLENRTEITLHTVEQNLESLVQILSDVRPSR